MLGLLMINWRGGDSFVLNCVNCVDKCVVDGAFNKYIIFIWGHDQKILLDVVLIWCEICKLFLAVINFIEFIPK